MVYATVSYRVLIKHTSAIQHLLDLAMANSDGARGSSCNKLWAALPAKTWKDQLLSGSLGTKWNSILVWPTIGPFHTTMIPIKFAYHFFRSTRLESPFNLMDRCFSLHSLHRLTTPTSRSVQVRKKINFYLFLGTRICWIRGRLKQTNLFILAYPMDPAQVYRHV